MIYLDDVPVYPTQFPDKTSQVWKLNLTGKSLAQVTWNFESEAEFLQLAQIKTLLDSESIEATLKIDYLPYARQDKPVSNYATFGLHTFAKLLNTLRFNIVFLIDPHSKEALKLIRNSVAMYPILQLQVALRQTESNLICYPDKGALNKYSEVYKEIFIPFIYSEKVRDQLTGNIISSKLVGDCAGKKVLIVDDICDGGMTFKLLAEDLYKNGASEVSLFVTHGIFSKGIETLRDSKIKNIFTSKGEKL